MNTLRGRLLGSYVLVIGICLTIIAAALLLILRNSPLPSRQTYLQLNAIARASQPALQSLSGADANEIVAGLTAIAEANDIRTLIVSRDGEAIFDSTGRLRQGEQLQLQFGPGREGPGSIREGSFTDPLDGQTWLIVAASPRGRFEQTLLTFAVPQPRLPALAIFGVNLLRPMLQAGLIAFVASIVLAAVVSGSVAKPLKRIGQTAATIASGNFTHRAPISGPAEVRNLARAFNDMVAQVKLSHETQRDFMANVSHELKTPLTSIQGFAQAILDGAENDPAHAAGIIHDEAGRMHRMVEDLLDLARIESGQVAMARQHVDLAAIINAVTERLALRAADSGIQLVSSIKSLPALTGDGDRLAQVFTNLVDNALNHTARGGRVTIDANSDASGVTVAVIDNGKGIPDEELSRVFERFYQVDKSRARGTPAMGGVGLGLTIIWEIVEAHGGNIRVESVEGQGATFRVWLPLPRSDDVTIARRR